MKTENLLMPQAPVKTGAGVSLRSAAQNRTAAQGAKAGAESFDRALDDAKTAQQDKAAPKETEAKDAKDTREPEAKDAADAKETGDGAAAEKDGAAEDAVQDAAKRPDDAKKDKPGKTDKTDGKDAERAEASQPQETPATALGAMLLAMAGQAAQEAAPVLSADESLAETAPQSGAAEPAVVAGALDALLPQDEAKAQQAAQNRQLMELLAGKGADPRLESLTALTESAALPEAEAAAVLTDAQTGALTGARTRTDADGAATAKETGLFADVPLTVEDVTLPGAAQTGAQGEGFADARQEAQDRQSASAQPELALASEAGQGAEAAEATPLAARESGQSVQPQAQGAGVLPQGMGFAAAMDAAEAPQAAQPQAQQPADTYNVMQQIVEQARLIRAGSDTEMLIRLNPEHLGELTLRVAVAADGAVSASFRTENAQVRGLIESSMVQLKQELQQQGLKVENVSVYSGLSEDFFAQSQAGQQGYPQQGRNGNAAHGARADRAAYEDDAEAISAVPAASGVAPQDGAGMTAAPGGVDYLV